VAPTAFFWLKLMFGLIPDSAERAQVGRPAVPSAPPAAHHQTAARRASSVPPTASDHSGSQETVFPESAPAPTAAIPAAESVCTGISSINVYNNINNIFSTGTCYNKYKHSVFCRLNKRKIKKIIKHLKEKITLCWEPLLNWKARYS
jgi:hypothetical protein